MPIQSCRYSIYEDRCNGGVEGGGVLCAFINFASVGSKQLHSQGNSSGPYRGSALYRWICWFAVCFESSTVAQLAVRIDASQAVVNNSFGQYLMDPRCAWTVPTKPVVLTSQEVHVWLARLD